MFFQNILKKSNINSVLNAGRYIPTIPINGYIVNIQGTNIRIKKR